MMYGLGLDAYGLGLDALWWRSGADVWRMSGRVWAVGTIVVSVCVSDVSLVSTILLLCEPAMDPRSLYIKTLIV